MWLKTFFTVVAVLLSLLEAGDAASASSFAGYATFFTASSPLGCGFPAGSLAPPFAQVALGPTSSLTLQASCGGGC